MRGGGSDRLQRRFQRREGGSSIPQPPGHSSGAGRLAGAAIALSALIAHWPALRGGFINWDDFDYVTKNPLIDSLSPGNVARMFTTIHSGNWHPLSWLSHAVDWALFGDSPAGHHAVSVVIHAANALLLFLALRALTRAPRRSALVALLFAVHPLRVESVAWISERKDVLCGFFFLLTLLAHARHARAPSPSRYLAVVAASLLALLAKPMAVTLAAVLLLLDAWPLGRLSRRALLEKIPIAALSAGSAVVTLFAQQKSTLAEAAFADRVANAAVSTVAYLGKLAWPAALSPLYPFPGVGGAPALTAAAITGSALALLAISVAAVALRRRAPYVLFGWLWYLIMLLPVSGLIKVGYQSMADRYTYLPLIGVVIALVWAAAGLSARLGPGLQRAAGVLALAVIVGLTALSWKQAVVWRTTETVFRRALAVGPPSAVAYERLQMALIEKGLAARAESRLGAAADAFEEAVRLDPADRDARRDLAATLLLDGRVGAAVEVLRETLVRFPEDAQSRNLLAWSLATAADERLRDGEEAVRIAEQALAASGPQPPAHLLDTYAAALAETGRFERAVIEGSKAVTRARAAGDTALAAEASDRVAGYARGEAYRAPPR